MNVGVNTNRNTFHLSTQKSTIVDLIIAITIPNMNNIKPHKPDITAVA